MSRKKILTVIEVDNDNCRVYVKDQDEKHYVIVDHGHLFARYNSFRYELYSCTQEGEPNYPLTDVDWELPNLERMI